jgi:hypothetical protein
VRLAEQGHSKQVGLSTLKYIESNEFLVAGAKRGGLFYGTYNNLRVTAGPVFGF